MNFIEALKSGKPVRRAAWTNLETQRRRTIAAIVLVNPDLVDRESQATREFELTYCDGTTRRADNLFSILPEVSLFADDWEIIEGPLPAQASAYDSIAALNAKIFECERLALEIKDHSAEVEKLRRELVAAKRESDDAENRANDYEERADKAESEIGKARVALNRAGVLCSKRGFLDAFSRALESPPADSELQLKKMNQALASALTESNRQVDELRGTLGAVTQGLNEHRNLITDIWKALGIESSDDSLVPIITRLVNDNSRAQVELEKLRQACFKYGNGGDSAFEILEKLGEQLNELRQQNELFSARNELFSARNKELLEQAAQRREDEAKVRGQECPDEATRARIDEFITDANKIRELFGKHDVSYARSRR